MKPLITLIGCGKMGSAMLHGWLADDRLDADFAIIEPMSDHLDWTRDLPNVQIHADIGDAAAAGRTARIIVLAVKPQMMDEAISACRVLSVTKPPLSIAAGVTPTGSSTAWRQGDGAAFDAKYAGRRRQGVTALFAGDAPDDVTALAITLLSAIGSVVRGR